MLGVGVSYVIFAFLRLRVIRDTRFATYLPYSLLFGTHLDISSFVAMWPILDFSCKEMALFLGAGTDYSFYSSLCLCVLWGARFETYRLYFAFSWYSLARPRIYRRFKA